MFFGKPIRYTTEMFYPSDNGTMNVEDFCAEIKNSLDAFERNMLHLRQNKVYGKDAFIETWMETFAAWMEIEQRPDNEDKDGNAK